MNLKKIAWALLGLAVMTPEVFAWSDYMQSYGTSMTKSISVNPGTYSFEVDGVPSGYYGEWYVNGSYKETDTATYVSDPTYSYSFSSGSTTIKCLIYNKSWTLLNTHTWNVGVILPTFTLNASAGSGGSVSPSSRNVTQGNTTTFSVSPATGYSRGSVSGDGSGGYWSGNTYTTASATQNRNLTFSFVVNSYTVSASAGTGGTVSPSSRSVNHGGTTTFTVSPSAGYARGSVSGDASGGSWSGNTYTTAPVTQSRSLSFSFVPVEYSLSASSGTGGSVSPSSRTASYGTKTTFTVSPSTYYTRNSVSGDASGGSWSGNVYTTAPVTQNRSLSFSFTPWPDLVVASVWTEPASPIEGQGYVIKAIVRNQGAAAADPPLLDCIEMGFWVDGAYKGGERTTDLCYSIAANGGEYTFTSVPLTAPAAGSHTILAKADCNDGLASDVDEINEDNNTRSNAFATLSTTGAKITSFKAPVGLVRYGSTGTVTVAMQNTGTTTRAFWVGLSFSGPSSGTWPDGWYDVPPQQSATLAPKETQTVEFQFEIPYSLTPGQYVAHAAAWEGYEPTSDRMVEPRYDYQTSNSFVASGEYVPGVEDDPYGLAALDAGGLYIQIPKGNRGGLQDLQSHIANPLVDAKSGATLGPKNDRVVVVVHGWNPWKEDVPLRAGGWDNVTSQLRGEKLSGEWALVEYDWHNDAATGFIFLNEPASKAATLPEVKQTGRGAQPKSAIAAVWITLVSAQMAAEHDAIQSAERAYAHGIVLGKRLVDQIGASNLKQVQLVGHSAGSWAIYSALRYIALHAPGCEVQVTYLDPFIPDQTSYNLLPLLRHAFAGQILEQSVDYTRVTTPGAAKAEAYYTENDETELSNWIVWPSSATSVKWSWSGVSGAYVQELHHLDSSSTDWRGHGGPVDFFGDSIATPGALRVDGYGWSKSLAFNTTVERVVRLSGDLAFGDVAVGGRAQRTLTIHNDGNDPLNVSSVSLPLGYSGNWSGTIAPKGSQAVPVSFAPPAVQSYAGAAVVNSDATSGTNSMAISGRGIVAHAVICLSNAAISENQPAGTQVGTLTTVYTAGDAIAVVMPVYSLVPGAGSTDNSLFTINGNELRAASAFDFEAKNSFSIRIQSAGGLSTQQIFVVRAADVNESPTDIDLSNAHVPGNQPAGTMVGSLTAADPDGEDACTYALVNGDGGEDNPSFSISGNTLQTATLFDAATKAVCRVRIRCTDLGGLSCEKAFEISVVDLDERPTLSDVQMTDDANMVIKWMSIPGRRYAIHCATNLTQGFSMLQGNILATSYESAYTDTVQRASSKYWRVIRED